MQVILILTAFGHFMLNEEQIKFYYNHIPNHYLEIPGIWNEVLQSDKLWLLNVSYSKK